MISASSCSKQKTIDNNTNITKAPSTGNVDKDTDIKQSPVPTKISTVFDQNVTYLKGKGMNIPDLSPSSFLEEETILSLLTEAYEVMGGEIDITKVNPRYEASDSLKKLALIGVIDNSYYTPITEGANLKYSTVAYYLLTMHDSINSRIYAKNDTEATIQDLLVRINVSTALHTWNNNDIKINSFDLQDLMEGDVTLNQPLTKLMAAEIMSKAYETFAGEIDTTNIPKPVDSDSIYAWKANQFFYWSETNEFQPDQTGSWTDWSFMSAIIYDDQLRLNLDKDEANCPYGAVLAALTCLLESYGEMEKQVEDEVVVLNERHYDWHVYQYDTGEYGDFNCMPACIEMAFRYQGLQDIPSTESLRNEHLFDGLGWYDGVAENVMNDYGLKFTDSFDISMEPMLKALDEGNILYVMHKLENSEEGHAVLIKGYWKIGSHVNFIISDPAFNTIGPFGYIETIKDAETMLMNMSIHVPRYFIIQNKPEI